MCLTVRQVLTELLMSLKAQALLICAVVIQ